MARQCGEIKRAYSLPVMAAMSPLNLEVLLYAVIVLAAMTTNDCAAPRYKGATWHKAAPEMSTFPTVTLESVEKSLPVTCAEFCAAMELLDKKVPVNKHN